MNESWEDILKQHPETKLANVDPVVDIRNANGPTILTDRIAPPGLLKNDKIPPGQLKKWFEAVIEFEEHCDSYTGSSWDGPERECYKPVPGKGPGLSARAVVTMGLSAALLLFLV